MNGKKEAYYIYGRFSDGHGDVEETYRQVSGYTYRLVSPSPFPSFDFGITNYDVWGDKKGHWTATILPYGVKLLSGDTKAKTIEAVEAMARDERFIRALPMFEKSYQEKLKWIRDKALERDGKGEA